MWGTILLPATMSPSSRATIVVTSPDQLMHLIAHERIRQGERCDLNHLDVSRLTDFSFVFQDSTFNGDISQWDVSNAQIMARMFQGSDFTGDISRWSVSKVTNMGAMFAHSAFNGDISGWRPVSLVAATSMYFGPCQPAKYTRLRVLRQRF